MTVLHLSQLPLLLILLNLLLARGWAFVPTPRRSYGVGKNPHSKIRISSFVSSSSSGVRSDSANGVNGGGESDSVNGNNNHNTPPTKKRVVIIGAGWGGLSAAHALSSTSQRINQDIAVTVIDASPRVGGLVRDGFTTKTGLRPTAEAGQHGFWNNYHNIFQLLQDDIPGLNINQVLTDYAEQGQWSPRGLEAVWPVYRNQTVTLPTGLAQLAYTRFLGLPLTDLLTALPLVVAFSEFNTDSQEAWKRYDAISFRDLCTKLGVSQRCYDEAFEPMILTGLFAPGDQCSAAAALGMAYFFVLQSQTAFDVRWCRGNIGNVIFTPWIQQMKKTGCVDFECSTRVTGFDININDNNIKAVQCIREDGTPIVFEADQVIMAVGAKALNGFSRYCPELKQYDEFRRFANLRGTSVLATRIFLDKKVRVPYTANACWGFDKGVGMTMFDIRALHGDHATTVADAPGSVIEVDYYHANTLLAMTDDEIVAKVKSDLDNLLGTRCRVATVIDAAVVRLPDAVNWYFPGSWQDMPPLQSQALSNLYYAGDIVKTRHASWSQEKAFVTGRQAANLILGRSVDNGVIPAGTDELHVRLGKETISALRTVLGGWGGSTAKAPFFVDLLR